MARLSLRGLVSGIPTLGRAAGGSAPEAPVNISSPYFDETLIADMEVAINAGVWEGTPAPTITRIIVDSLDNVIATGVGATYTPQAADIGKTLIIRETADNGVGDPVIENSPGALVETWWLTTGIAIADVVAAYNPIGAASLAASYINLAHPGTNDAAPGVDPTWDTTDGWKFSTTQYLDTGIVPAANYSALIRFSGIPGANDRQIFGCWSSSANKFGIAPNRSSGQVAYYNGGSTLVAPATASGTLAIAGADGYRNGTDEADIAAFSAEATLTSLIGGYNTPTPNVNIAVNVQAHAIYNKVLTPTQVATITARMAALPN